MSVPYYFWDPIRGPSLENYPYIWEFPKISGTLFGGPYNKDYPI